MQTHAPECHAGSRTGLYDIRINPDLNVFVACGLGGTSLLNANVALQADCVFSTLFAGPTHCVIPAQIPLRGPHPF